MDRTLSRLAALSLLWAIALPLAAQTYTPATAGTRWLETESGSLAIKVLVESTNLGGAEVEVGEIVFAPRTLPSGSHRHGAVEIFYVLEGTLEHVVNGVTHVLTPGMVGIVRPGDAVTHRVPGDEPVRALVVWAPGGEVDRIAPGFEQRPVGGGAPGGGP